ncbi:predicted GCN5-related N-acetyltransferase [Alteracholeplasma palmae J233]|uniref:Predicted GCN5-related N-acetyltransferase n=2 Tax=Acholeplasma palmae TaxID=38986 RepID=U4KKY2_ALTPJ|nr:predicted GCN5-related N-acetyltransferase [Alteracholeplasma palmae J233]
MPETNDLTKFHEYAIKPNVGPQAGWHPHQSIIETKIILKSFINENETWAITVKPYNEIIGTIDLKVLDFFDALEGTYEIGYSLNDIYWNKGYMTEAIQAVLEYAFAKMGATKVIASHAPFNEASKKVLLKNGFIFTHIEKTNKYLSFGINELYYYEIKNKRKNK